MEKVARSNEQNECRLAMHKSRANAVNSVTVFVAGDVVDRTAFSCFLVGIRVVAQNIIYTQHLKH